eukprot:scaffold733_cov267-Pinguiococcus_pyrenoidosus.AAC.49
MSSGFGGRDLALALSSQVGDAYSLRHTKDASVQIEDEQKPKLDKSRKVLRYRKGVQPRFATDSRCVMLARPAFHSCITCGRCRHRDDDDGFIRPEIGSASAGKVRLKNAYVPAEQPKVVDVASDPRLLRLQRSRRPVESEIVEDSGSESDDSDDSTQQNRVRARRRVVQTEILEASDSDSDSEVSPVKSEGPTDLSRSKLSPEMTTKLTLQVGTTKQTDSTEPQSLMTCSLPPRVRQAPVPKPIAPRIEFEQKQKPGQKQKPLQKHDEAPEDEDSSESATSSSEEEDDDDDDDDDLDLMGGSLPMLRPKFIPKDKRKLKGAEEEKQRNEEVQFELERARQEERRRETRRLVALEVQREAEAGHEVRRFQEYFGASGPRLKPLSWHRQADITDNDSEAGMPDDMDVDDDEVEYEKWKVRELRRLVRDKEERERRAEEARETERRRQMTDDEIMREDRALGKLAGNDTSRRDESKQGFMQKYYHKGAFFMDEESLDKLKKSKDPRKEDVRRRDYTEATGFDKFNIEALPEVMQRAGRKFGLRSQTKYTHLNAEDTTDHRAERLDVVKRSFDQNRSVFDAKRKKQRRT